MSNGNKNAKRRATKSSGLFSYEKLEARQLLAIDIANGLSYSNFDADALIYNLAEPVPATEQVSVLSKHLGLQPGESFELAKVEADQIGFEHYKYNQLYNGYQVEAGSYTVHVKDDQIVSLSGDWVDVLDAESDRPTLTSGLALRSVLDDLGKAQYIWDSPEVASLFDLEGVPTGELRYFTADDGEVHLAYKFDIYLLEPHERAFHFVDANDAELLAEVERFHSVDVPATGVSLYDGTVNFIADDDGTEIRLRQAVEGVETFTLNSSTDYGDAVDVTNDTTDYTDPEDSIGVQAHFGAESTYKYFLETHGRDSYDDAGSVLTSYVSFGNNFVNAFWNGSAMTYGDGNGTSIGPLVSLDVAGHEIGHGVTEFSANLVYRNEPGALNESFSDIFGEAVERFGRGSNDWAIGGDIFLNGGAIRSMENPKLFNNPDTYLGEFWEFGSFDNGGVHINSGVQNKWFYLLSDGGTGTNDNGDDYDITAIGFDDAELIAYRNLSTYLTVDSQYFDAREGSIQAATDLFGADSVQVETVKDAWDAVGVYGEALEVDLRALRVNGSMIYGGSVLAGVAADEVQELPLELDANQKLSIVLEPSNGLQPRVIIEGPNGIVDSGVGDPLIIQSADIVDAGEYTIFIDGLNGTSGDFLMTVYLNTNVELESYSLGDNSSFATAQDISSSAISLNDHADRMAVVGSIGESSSVVIAAGDDFETGTLGEGWTTSSSDANGRIIVTGGAGTGVGNYALFMDQEVSGTYNLNEAIYTTDLSDVDNPTLSFYHAEWGDETHGLPLTFTGSYNGDGVSVSDDGVNWYTILSETNTPPGEYVKATYNLAEVAANAGIELGENFQIKFQQYDNYAYTADGRAYDEIEFSTVQQVTDFYSFDLADGEMVSAAVARYQGQPVASVDLYDSEGNLLGTGSEQTNVQGYVSRYTNDTGAAGTFYVGVTGLDVDYSLVVTRGADFDVETNDISNPQAIDGTTGILGDLTGTAEYAADPDSLPGGAILDTAFNGLTLRNGVTNGSVWGATSFSYAAPTGSLVFGAAAGDSSGWQEGVNELRADFDTPVSRVAISVGADDLSDSAFLRAFSADGTLLAELTSGTVALNDSEVIEYDHGSDEIAFVIMGGNDGDATPLDNLIYTIQTADTDYYTFDVNVGDEIVVDPRVPGFGPGEFDNGLDNDGENELRVDLMDANGNTLFADQNSMFGTTATTTGTYTLLVHSNNGASGEYFVGLNVEEQNVNLGFDFGEVGQDVQPGYAEFSDGLFDPALGFGWSFSGPYSTNISGRGDALVRDGISVTNGTFMVNVPDGAYDVDVHFPRSPSLTDTVRVTVEDTPYIFIPEFGETRTFSTTVSDGQLTLGFSGNGGISRQIKLAGIRIATADALLRPSDSALVAENDDAFNYWGSDFELKGKEMMATADRTDAEQALIDRLQPFFEVELNLAREVGGVEIAGLTRDRFFEGAEDVEKSLEDIEVFDFTLI